MNIRDPIHKILDKTCSVSAAEKNRFRDIDTRKKVAASNLDCRIGCDEDVWRVADGRRGAADV
jgi:hypothetical protein